MKIKVKVKPNSKQQKIVAVDDSNLIVSLKSPPVNGKANRELIAVLATKYRVTKSQIIIKSGLLIPIKCANNLSTAKNIK